MANLVVSGNITINGNQVALLKDTPQFTEYTILYEASSVSTGNKNLNKKPNSDERYKFSEFKSLAFAEIATATDGYAWCFMTVPIFTGIGGFYVQQNIATNDRRFKMNYVSDSVFNVSYVDNGGGIMVIGFN